MPQFRQSIPFRLYVGLIVAVLLVLMVGFIATSALWRQTDEANWVEHTYQVKEQLRDARLLLGQMRTGRRDFWITGNDKFLAPYIKGQSLVLPSIEALKKEVSDNPVQIANVNTLESLIAELFRYWQTDGRLLQGDNQDKARKVIENEEGLLSTVYVQFDKIRAEEDRLLGIRLINKHQYNQETRIVLLSGIGVLLVVVLLLVVGIVNVMKSRYRAHRRMQETLAETERLHMAASEKNWQLEGVSRVNDAMRGNAGTAELAGNIVQAVVQYMQVPACALFVINENNGLLEQAAASGVIAGAQKTFALGEGLVGSAALRKDLAVIHEIPAGYWKVESALGQMSGRGEIAYLPLWLNDELKGVMEIGRFSAFTEAHLAFLHTIANNIAIGINTSLAREKIDSLLKKLQEQQEALEHQQEELRQTNEELTRQTEILQSSEEELRVQEEELRHINAELEEKNEAVEMARHALMMKAEELQVTGKYKSEFLANMSHELRTPLNSILILAKLLAENKAANLNEKQVEYANIIHKSGSDLLKLINDILDLSKIEAGKVEFSFEQVPVATIASDLRELFNVVAEEKEVQFTTTIGELTAPEIYTDRQRLEQVLKNLLSNAFKFTPKGGQVNLHIASLPAAGQPFAESRLLQAKQVLAFSVKDTGIGIAAGKQQLVFDAFRQADGATNRKYGGTGLGLSISRELVRQLGGEIKVTSEEGKGSVFTVYLPLQAASAIADKAGEAALPASPEPTQLVQQARVEDDRNNLQPHDKIMLIIEDDAAFASVIRDFSRSRQYKAIVALQGDEGLYYARKYRPTAIILDMQLPVIDGWNLLKVLKNDPALKAIPVHIISGADESKLHTNGALAYLRKPVAKEDLEKAFDLIGNHLLAKVKKVLVLSGDYIKDDSLRRQLDHRHFDVDCIYAHDVDEALQKASEMRFDCIIADIGNNIEKGVNDLQRLQTLIEKDAIPVIIYLDKDISATDELKLKKVSNVVIRESSHSQDRLLDEMELFLYKVQEAGHAPVITQNIALADNNSLAGKKILLVDDDMRNVFALSTALEEHQMEVFTASDGREALEQLKAHKDIHLVLMDIMMPEMDGYEATRKIRTELNLVKLPVIALTAKAMSGDREKSIEAGASDYITKPVDINRLFSLLRVWLNNK